MSRKDAQGESADSRRPLPALHACRMAVSMLPRSPLEDPESAAVAWARYRKLMRWMMMFTTASVAIAMMLLYKQNGMVSIHLFIAAALGIGVAMLLMSALMGLVFLSNGTGHDEIVTRNDDSRNDEKPGDKQP